MLTEEIIEDIEYLKNHKDSNTCLSKIDFNEIISSLKVLKAEILESYEAIVEAKIITLQTGSQYCRFCKDDWRNHASYCIVPKAEKYIKENK